MVNTVSIKDGEVDIHLRVGEEQVRDYLDKLDIFMSAGLDEAHPRVLKELAEVIAKPLAIISENLRRTGEVLGDRERTKVVIII